MPISFGKSDQGTIGIEWELALLDAKTLNLAPRAPEILACLGDSETGHYRAEFMDHIIEIVTGVHTNVPEAVAELTTLLAALQVEANKRGLEVLSTGTHPFAKAADVRIGDKPRYQAIRNRVGYWADRLVICGTHIHVGLDEAAKALPIVQGLTVYLPHMLTLSASSPFWEGEPTGYASQRTMLFQQLPSAGLPPGIDDWDTYERYYDDLVAAGMVMDTNEIRWDIRPSPRFGTVENRVLDGTPTLREIGTLAAFTQCTVEWLSRRLDAGARMPRLDPWLVRENKWRAARYGLEADVIVPGARLTERPMRDSLQIGLEVLTPVAADLGCTAEIEFAAELLTRGPSYVRQQQVYERTGDLREVVAAAVAEARSGAPIFAAEKASERYGESS